MSIERHAAPTCNIQRRKEKELIRMLREPNPRIIPIPPSQNATGRFLSVQRVLRRTRCTDLSPPHMVVETLVPQKDAARRRASSRG